MAKLTLLNAALLALLACRADIKNPDAEVSVEPGTRADTAFAKMSPHASEESTPLVETVVGYWIGDFKPDVKDKQKLEIYTGEHTAWTRTNKINLSIDCVTRDSVFGHSVVAGNDRPFRGSMTQGPGGSQQFEVREPGDNRYDGSFAFTIDSDEPTGTWQAYKKIEIPQRRYTLRRRTFVYNPNFEVENSRYVDWTRYHEEEASEAEVEEAGSDVEVWMEKTYAASTMAAFELNASAERLTDAQVANLKRGDLIIIRNAIYARHGYSFRERPLRAFFDQQDWYIPVHADITSAFTPVELANIKLLLRYEGNAAEYYDRFGRG